MIHKQYMDLLNTSPTFFFFYLRNASLQGVKAFVDTKTVHRFVLTHHTQIKTNEWPSICKGSKRNTHMRAIHLKCWCTHTGKSWRTQRMWGRYLTNIFRGQLSPHFLILVKGWVVMLGEQAADNLKERRSLYSDRATRHELETWGKGFLAT